MDQLSTNVIPQVGRSISEILGAKRKQKMAHEFEQQTGIPGIGSLLLQTGDPQKAFELYDTLLKTQAQHHDLRNKGFSQLGLQQPYQPTDLEHEGVAERLGIGRGQISEGEPQEGLNPDVSGPFVENPPTRAARNSSSVLNNENFPSKRTLGESAESREGDTTLESIYNPESAKESAKTRQEVAKKRARAKGLFKTVDTMRSLIKYTGSTSIPFTSSFNAKKTGLNRKGLQMRNKFDGLAADFASFFRDLETKGQLPQGLYEQVIKPRLPNSELSERENLGRIDAIEQLARQYAELEDPSQMRSDKSSRPSLQDIFE